MSMGFLHLHIVFDYFQALENNTILLHLLFKLFVIWKHSEMYFNTCLWGREGKREWERERKRKKERESKGIKGLLCYVEHKKLRGRRQMRGNKSKVITFACKVLERTLKLNLSLILFFALSMWSIHMRCFCPSQVQVILNGWLTKREKTFTVSISTNMVQWNGWVSASYLS